MSDPVRTSPQKHIQVGCRGEEGGLTGKGLSRRGLESLLGVDMLSILICRFHGCRCLSEMKFYKLTHSPYVASTQAMSEMSPVPRSHSVSLPASEI